VSVAKPSVIAADTTAVGSGDVSLLFPITFGEKTPWKWSFRTRMVR